MKDMKHYTEFPNYFGHSFREASEAAMKGCGDRANIGLNFMATDKDRLPIQPERFKEQNKVHVISSIQGLQYTKGV